MFYLCVIFVRRKTAYEVRISDWSSDVCSSALRRFSALPVIQRRKSFRTRRTSARSCASTKGPSWQSPSPRISISRKFMDWGSNERAVPQYGDPRSCCRSEEHTSELQSLMRISYAVFCLKKKNYKNRLTHKYISQI